jgi:hypothetical protein
VSQESNKRILEILSRYVEENPDLRWGQVLQNTQAVLEEASSGGEPWEGPRYTWRREIHTESRDVLDRIERKILREELRDGRNRFDLNRSVMSGYPDGERNG